MRQGAAYILFKAKLVLKMICSTSLLFPSERAIPILTSKSIFQINAAVALFILVTICYRHRLNVMISNESKLARCNERG